MPHPIGKASLACHFKMGYIPCNDRKAREIDSHINTRERVGANKVRLSERAIGFCGPVG